MKVCPSCGTSNPDTARFCQECGTRLPDAETSPVTDTAASPEGADSAESETPSETIVARPKKDVSGLPPSWMPTPVTLPSRDSAAAPTPEPEKPEPTRRRLPFGKSDTEKSATAVEEAPTTPTPVDFLAERERVREAVPDDWKMSSAGPLPEREGRRLWLWIPVGVVSVVLIICVAFFLWAATIGSDTVDGWATNVATNQTEQAGD